MKWQDIYEEIFNASFEEKLMIIETASSAIVDELTRLGLAKNAKTIIQSYYAMFACADYSLVSAEYKAYNLAFDDHLSSEEFFNLVSSLARSDKVEAIITELCKQNWNIKMAVTTLGLAISSIDQEVRDEEMQMIKTFFEA